MKLKRLLTITSCTILAVVIFLSGFWAGSRMPRREEASFYARITGNETGMLYVEGLPENDINHRGKFMFALDKLDVPNTAFAASGKKIPVSTLNTGQLVRIVYEGEVLETSPVIIPNVNRIYVIE